MISIVKRELVLALSLSLVTGPLYLSSSAAHAAPKAHDSTTPSAQTPPVATDGSFDQITEAQKIFDFYNNSEPLFHEAVMNARLEKLRSEDDSKTTRLQDSNELLGVGDDEFKVTADKIADQGTLKNLLGMKLLVGINPNDAVVLKIARQAAKSQGLTDLEISKIDFFRAQGPINAYTFSGVDSHHVVVLFSGLINAFTDKNGHIMEDELRGVIGHELSHIIDGHINQSIRATAMLMTLYKMFVGSDEAKGKMFDSVGKLNMAPGTQELWNKILDLSAIKSYAGSLKNSADEKNENVAVLDAYKRKNLLDAAQTLSLAMTSSMEKEKRAKVAQAKKSNRALAILSVNNYLDGMIEILETSSVSGKLIEYFKFLRASTNHYTVISETPESFLAAATQLMAVISRADEASADAGGWLTSSRGDRIGKVDGTFGGSEYAAVVSDPGAYNREIRLNHNDILAQLIRFYADADYKEAASIIDGVGNHPASNFREVNTFEGSRLSAVAGFRDPSLRTLMARSRLLKDVEAANRILAQIDKEVAGAEGKIPDDQKKQIEIIRAKYVDLSGKSQGLADQVGARLTRFFSSGKFDKNGRNARLIRLMDFSLANKIDSKVRVEKILKLKEIFKDNKEALSGIDMMVQQEIKTGNEGDDLLSILSQLLATPDAAASPEFKKASSTYSLVIQGILAPGLTLKNAESFRQKLAEFRKNPNGLRWTTITSNERLKGLGIPTDGARFNSKPAAADSDDSDSSNGGNGSDSASKANAAAPEKKLDLSRFEDPKSAINYLFRMQASAKSCRQILSTKINKQ